MKKNVEELLIGRNPRGKYLYSVNVGPDGNSLIIQRITKLGNRQYRYTTLVSFIGCEDYVFTTTEVDENKYDVTSRKPTSEYESNIPDEHAKYRHYCVQVETSYNYKLRASLDNYNEDEEMFNRFAITSVEDDTELLVAYVDVDEDNEIQITSFGYPAGSEIDDI